jgi:hypothetical protein
MMQMAGREHREEQTRIQLMNQTFASVGHHVPAIEDLRLKPKPACGASTNSTSISGQ